MYFLGLNITNLVSEMTNERGKSCFLLYDIPSRRNRRRGRRGVVTKEKILKGK